MKIKEKFEKDIHRTIHRLNENLATEHFLGKKPCIVEAYYGSINFYDTKCSKYETCDKCIQEWLNEEG